MAKPTAEQWRTAKALHESGKSLREISNLTNIAFTTIDYRAKKEGWNKGIIEQLIVDKIRVETDFRTLDSVQQQVVQKEVDRALKLTAKRDLIAMAAFDRIHAEMPTCEARDIKSLVDAADRVCVMSEIAPRFNAPPVINNTNAQQNNSEPVRFTRASD